jgi:hypothetical protein
MSRSLSRGERGDYVAGYGFATADGVYAFVGFGFEVDFFWGDAEGFSQDFAHFGEVWAEFRLFKDDDGVYVLDGKMFFIEEFAGVFEEDEAIGILPFGIGVWKMRPDIAESGGAEERVA